MGTRATYCFAGSSCGLNKNNVTFYCHYDNYPEGAADRFDKMLRNKLSEVDLLRGQYRGNFPENFVRANEDAEFTSDRETHGDTEYHYEVTGDQIVAYGRTWTDGDRWKEVFRGSLYEFINKYSAVNGEQWVEPYFEIENPARYSQRTLWVNKPKLLDMIDFAEKQIERMEQKNYSNDNPNLTGAKNELAAYQAALLQTLEAA